MDRHVVVSRLNTLWVLALALGLMMGLSACSTDEDDDDGGGSGSSTTSVNPVPSGQPLSSVVAASFRNPRNTGVAAIDDADNIADYVKALVNAYDGSGVPTGVEFPLSNTSDDTVRAITGLQTNVLARWLDPLGYGEHGPRFGANADYIAYFGDGWNNDWATRGGIGSAPQYNGSGQSAWMWVNHEYISNSIATTTSAANGQWYTLAQFMENQGGLTNDVSLNTWSQQDVDTLNYAARQQLGGTWMRVYQDPYNLEWKIDRSANNLRYDATSNTLARVTGFNINSNDHDDFGNPLPNQIVVGIHSDCSGGQTPWGTVVTCEENVQSYYGDLENCWTSQQLFTHDTGGEFAAGGNVSPDYSTDTGALFGSHSDTDLHHEKDVYGFPVEIDPGEYPSLWYESNANGGDGRGHRKIGGIGRARWENVCFVTDASFELIDDQPIVMYGGDDRRGGRIFKFVTSQNYQAGDSRARVRELLDDGTLYVAHFEDLDNDTGDTINSGSTPGLASGTFGGGQFSGQGQGTGRWVEMSLSSTDIAPNAGASLNGNTYVTDVGTGTTTVGAALQDNNYNGIGAFNSDNLVKACLFTASNKIGIKELNRPEDLEWDPVRKLIYVAFTKHGRRNALDANGVLHDPATQSTTSTRPDSVGSIFAMVEDDQDDPSQSTTFTFWRVFQGTQGTGALDVANPDNLMIDADGDLWFGTDGNYGTNGTADAVYYMDIAANGFGRAFRVISGPSDSEFTGPCLSSDMTTLFGSVQHPGEGETSSWPTDRSWE